MAKEWDMHPRNMLFVGDSADDVKCGTAAGMKTVLFDPESKRPHLHSSASLVFQSFSQLQEVLTHGVHL